MANLQVNIIAGNTEIETKIGSKVLIGALAKQVASATDNPLLDDKSNPVIYSFKHNEKVLDPEAKVGDSGIRNGDRLVLTQDGLMVQGGTKLETPADDNFITVLIVITPNSTKCEKTLPVNTGIPDLIKTLINENNLDLAKVYSIRSRHTGKELNTGTLFSNDIPHKDTLTLATDAMAG